MKKNNQSHNQTFGLNYFYFRFFSPIYQGEKLNISMCIGMLTPSWYTGKEVGRQMASSEHTRPTFGINIDYNVTKEQRIDWQLFYRQDGQNSIIYSGLSYKINIKPVYTWIYYDNYINATIPENSFAQFIVVMTNPFGKDDRFLAGGSIGYTMGYSDKKFDIAKGFIGAVFCVDFNDLW